MTKLSCILPFFVMVSCVGPATGQTPPYIPKPLGDQFSYDASGVLHLSKGGESLAALGTKDKWVLSDFTGIAAGAETGIQLDFKKPDSTAPWLTDRMLRVRSTRLSLTTRKR